MVEIVRQAVAEGRNRGASSRGCLRGEVVARKEEVSLADLEFRSRVVRPELVLTYGLSVSYLRERKNCATSRVEWRAGGRGRCRYALRVSPDSSKAPISA